MEAEELVKIISNDYEVILENNMPIIMLASGKNFDKEVSKISKSIRRMGYYHSFGVRVKKAIENV